MSAKTMTNESLFVAFQVLQALSAKEFTTMLSYKIAKIMLEVRAEFELLQETRQTLGDKYAIKDEDGLPQTTTDEDGNVIPKFTDDQALDREWKELMEAETTVNVDALSVADFGETVEVAPVHLEILMKAGLLTE